MTEVARTRRPRATEGLSAVAAAQNKLIAAIPGHVELVRTLFALCRHNPGPPTRSVGV